MRKLLILLPLFFCLPSQAAITHVAANCSGSASTSGTTNNFYTFACTPSATNDAIVFIVQCEGTGSATGVTLTASGWTITALSTVFTTGSQSSATFGALAPNTSAATFTATFTSKTNCASFTYHSHDEFAGASTVGGTTTFSAHNQNQGTTGGCTGAAVTPVNNDNAIWFACVDNATAVAGGYTKGQDDGANDWTEYKILSGGSGAAQNPSFTSSGAFMLGSVAISPPAVGGVVRHRAQVIQQ